MAQLPPAPDDSDLGFQQLFPFADQPTNFTADFFIRLLTRNSTVQGREMTSFPRNVKREDYLMLGGVQQSVYWDFTANRSYSVTTVGGVENCTLGPLGRPPLAKAPFENVTLVRKETSFLYGPLNLYSGVYDGFAFQLWMYPDLITPAVFWVQGFYLRAYFGSSFAALPANIFLLPSSCANSL